MSYSDDKEIAHKTGRIALLCVAMICLGLFLFLFKIDACKYKKETCHEEFIEFNNNAFPSGHKCFTGATIEIFSSPSVTKQGMLCHCPKIESNNK